MSSTTKSRTSLSFAKGAFESSFAEGLDISEFNSSTIREPATSAAAELLCVKALEKEQRAQEAAAEEQLQTTIKNKVSALEQALTRSKENSGSVVVDALVKMHGHDTSQPSYRIKKERTDRRSGRHRTASSKSVIAKKSRRIKHSR